MGFLKLLAKVRLSLLLGIAYSPLLVCQPTEIIFWHSMAGQLGAQVSQLTEQFNHSQTEYTIRPIFKGEYSDALTSYAAAFNAGHPPDIIQVYEVGTGTMLFPKGVVKPLDDLLSQYSATLPIENFLPALASFYSMQDKLQAMPFNSSVPVLYYNADKLKQLNIDESTFPKTWQGLEALAKKIKAFDNHCAYTTAYPSWIHIESFSALHGLPLVNNTNNQVAYNNSAIVKHLTRLKRWQTKHYFEYGGQNDDATILFTSGRCAMFSQSSGSYRSLQEMAKFKVGIAPLPLDTDVSQQRHNNVIGGAALWASNGLSETTYRGILAFYAFLSQPLTQQQWHEHTGYIPLFVDNNHQPTILTLAKNELSQTTSSPTNYTQIPQNQIRLINDEAMEAIFSGITSPEKAMNNAATRANFTLLRYRRNTH